MINEEVWTQERDGCGWVQGVQGNEKRWWFRQQAAGKWGRLDTPYHCRFIEYYMCHVALRHTTSRFTYMIWTDRVTHGNVTASIVTGTANQQFLHFTFLCDV